MARILRRESLLGHLVDASNVVGVLLIWAIMLLMCADVFSRNLLSQPIAGVSHMVASSIVAIVFLQLASAVRNDRLTRADFLFGLVAERSPSGAATLRMVFNLIGAGVCLAIAYWTWPRLENAWSRSEFIGVVGVMTFPSWPVVAIVLYGATLAAAQFVATAVSEVLTSGRSAPKEGS